MGSQRPVRRGAGAAGVVVAAAILVPPSSAALGFDLWRRGFFFAPAFVLAAVVDEFEFCADVIKPPHIRQPATTTAKPRTITLLFLTIVPPFVIREHFERFPSKLPIHGVS